MRKLSGREINGLGAASAVIVCVALWSTVIAPSWTVRTDSFGQLRKIDIVWAVLDQLPPSAAQVISVDQPPLRQRVTDTARAAAIDIRRLDPQGTALSVSLDAVAFTALIGWLETLTTKSGVHVLAAEIGRRTEPGIVSARILVEDAL